MRLLVIIYSLLFYLTASANKYTAIDGNYTIEEARNLCKSRGQKLAEIWTVEDRLEAASAISKFRTPYWIDLERHHIPFSRFPERKTSNSGKLYESSCECVDHERCTACRELLSQFVWRRSNLCLADTPLYTDNNNVTTNDSSLITFIENNWTRGNPSAYSPNETVQEYCVNMLNNKMNDNRCDARTGVLCETDTFTAENSVCNSGACNCSFVNGYTVADVYSSIVVNTSVVLENVELSMSNKVNITVKGCYNVLANVSINLFVDKGKHNDVIFLASFDCSNFGSQNITIHHNYDKCTNVTGIEKYNSKSLSVLLHVSGCATAAVPEALVLFCIVSGIIIVLICVSLLVYIAYKRLKRKVQNKPSKGVASVVEMTARDSNFLPKQSSFKRM